MSLPPETNSKPVSWVSVAAVFGCFALFLLIIYIAYLPYQKKADEADLSQVSPDDQWQYSVKGREDKLKDLRAHEQTELTTYGWIDEKAGVVRLPIDRAMELTLQSLQARK